MIRMNEQADRILTGTGKGTFQAVARGALGDDSAVIVGNPAFDEITSSHADARTIGIVKVSGSARVAGEPRSWSSVVKIIDAVAEPGPAALWSFPEIEQKVYELGLFTGDGLSLRPAHCYLIQSIEPGLKILWLEDLSHSPQPPWTLEQFASAANHLGQFNGYHSVNRSRLPIELTRDGFHLRWAAMPWSSNFARLVEDGDHALTRRMYFDTPVETGLELAILFEQALQSVKSLDHGIAFGDSHARNLFPVGSQTVGIDWASLASDPVGCDIGVLLGSPLSFTATEVQMVVRNERAIYDSYIAGLTSAGWQGNLDHVRLAFFSQFAGYLAHAGLFSITHERFLRNDERRNRMEKRLGVAFEDAPELKVPVIALYPNYAEELKQLLEKVRTSPR